jgi:hypothetical protein
MKTAKDTRLDLVRDQYVLKKIHSVSDLYAIIPLAAFATATNILTSHFHNPANLTISDLNRAGSLMKIPASFLFNLFECEVPFVGAGLDLSERDKLRISLLHDSIRLGSIRTLDQIIEVIPRTTIALRIGTNNNNLREFILNPEPYDLRFVQRIAWALSITPLTLFSCIDNNIREKRGFKPVKVKLERKQLDKMGETVIYLGAKKI